MTTKTNKEITKHKPEKPQKYGDKQKQENEKRGKIIDPDRPKK